MLKLATSKTYKKSLRKLLRSGNFDENKLIEVVNKLLGEQKLEEKHRDHSLNGQAVGYRDCHIYSDLVLIYKIDKLEGVLGLFNIGSHSDLFG